MNPTRRGVLFGSAGLLLLSACGSEDSESSGSGGSAGETPTLGISAIPDQDPELLNRLYPLVADRIAEATGLEVEYKPVTDYTAVVRAFEVGDVAVAWMGGLTGVQARNRLEGSQAFAQRDIDPDFHSLFIATKDSGLEEISDASGLTSLAGKTFTFGSETSTSGRLMPQYFMDEGGFDVADLQGEPGYSGSHDATIEAVASGSFEAGAVNEQVWQVTLEDGELDVSNVVVMWRTPGYPDYHWLARPDLDETYGAGTMKRIADMLFALDVNDPEDARILELFGAESFIPAENSEYDQIEAVAEQLGLLA